MFESYWRDQGGKPACIRSVRLERLTYGQRRRSSRRDATDQHSLRRRSITPSITLRGFVYLENPYLTDNGVITKLARAGGAASIPASSSPSSPIRRRSITPTR